MAESDPNPFDEIDAELREKFELLGTQMDDKVREWIGIDVGFAKGRIVRSKPGEHPRKETGRLQGSFDNEATLEDGVIKVTVFTDVPYAIFLQNGTSKMAKRPIIDGLLELFDPQLDDIVTEALAD